MKAVVELSLSLLMRVEDDAEWEKGCVPRGDQRNVPRRGALDGFRLGCLLRTEEAAWCVPI